MATLFTVGVEVQTSAAQQAIAKMERGFERLAGSSRDLGRSTQALDREFDKAAKGVAGMSKAADELTRSSERATEGLTVMRVALGNLVSSAVMGGVRMLTSQFQQLGSNVINTGAQAEKTAVAFETFLGSAQKAKDVMKQVRDFAATTPFELPEVTAAAKQLLATRTSADQLIPTIQMLGEIAAGADKPLSQLLFVYTQIKNQGRATGEDINQLLNAGLSMDDIARALGRTAKELGQMKGSSKGLQLSFEEVERVLKGVTSEGGRFNGLMDKLGSTTAVKLSNLNDAFTKIYQSIYDGISPAIAGVLDVIVGILDPLGENKTLWAEVNAQALNFKGYLEQNPAIISTISKGLEDGIKVGLKAATDLAKGLLGYLDKNPDAIAKAVGQVDLLIKGLAKAYEIIALSVEGWGKIAQLGKMISGGDRITPTSGAERILEAGGTANDAKGFQDEVNRRLRALPWWNGLNNAKKEEIVKEVFEDVLARVNQQQQRLKQATQSTTPPPQPEAQKQTQQAITTELQKQAQALESQLPKQRALADLEITRMQQRLDLERAYGQISQEEILRREAAIRLRRNELSLANLSLEKAEQEQRIKNGENVTRQDFSAQETALREENSFIQQKLVADVARVQRELSQRESEQRLKAEQDMYNLRRDHEIRLYQLQVENYQFVRERELRGKNDVENAVLSLVRNIENIQMSGMSRYLGYSQQYDQDLQQWNRLDAQKKQIEQFYGAGAPPEIHLQYQEVLNQMNQIATKMESATQIEQQARQNVSTQIMGLIQDLDNLFIDKVAGVTDRIRQENGQMAIDARVAALPEGARIAANAGRDFESIYSEPRAKLEAARDRALSEGNAELAGIFDRQVKQLVGMLGGEKLAEIEQLLLVNRTSEAIVAREGERSQFESSLEAMAQAEADRTKSLQDQLQLMSLQGDEKEKAIASLKAEEVIEQRRRELMKQMEGAPQDSMYYAYMVKELEVLEANLTSLTAVFYEQGQAQSAVNKEIELFNEQMRMTQAIADGLGDSFANAFGEFVMGTKSAQEAFAGMMGSMANVFMQEFQRMVSQKAAAGLFGLIGNLFGGGFGGMFGGGGAAIANAPQASLSGIGAFNFGSGGGSSGFSVGGVSGFDDLAPRIIPFADGGVVTKPMVGLVGEAGREAIIPLDKLDAMGGNNVTINVSVANDGSTTVDKDGGSQLGRELESAVVAVLQKQKRPGGLLASVR